jgi:protein-tyrosine-phosphatase
LAAPLEKPPAAVLFACSMNAVRSPMAAGITRHLFPSSIYAASVGVHQGTLDPFVPVVMEEIGIDISAHRITTFDDFTETSFDLVVTLAPEAHHRALEMTRTLAFDVEYWPTFDPTLEAGSREQRLGAYRRVRDGLMSRIKQRFRWQPPPSG